MMNRCKDQYILQHAGHTHTPGAGGNKDTGSSDESRPPEELYCVSLMFSPCSIPVLYAEWAVNVLQPDIIFRIRGACW